MQAGKQLEWLTGGYVQAGFHEVRSLRDSAISNGVSRERMVHHERMSQWGASKGNGIIEHAIAMLFRQGALSCSVCFDKGWPWP